MSPLLQNEALTEILDATWGLRQVVDSVKFWELFGSLFPLNEFSKVTYSEGLSVNLNLSIKSIESHCIMEIMIFEVPNNS